ncbi:acyl-CoA-like ligand-binding transcription factor [Nocardia suismassiliense]|uniref:acyl-CoA-like ligand-binding transcription factor n=1 Tax=Nocardia suismassiliense TaxID=2077092 RepID=UPI000D1E76C4|nr:TetR family transcriptional regulator [Nocardia suismassiliense]
MSVDLSGEEPAVRGLRERKKERTRRTIRLEAFRLFREQGYGETTVEQIAAAAEVSPSTFFRYFPTKEQLVLADDLDPVLIEAFRAQPPDLAPLTAFRHAMAAVFAELPAEQQAFEQERQALIYHVPELRSAIGLEMERNIDMVSAVMAERVGGTPDDFDIRVLAGALTGAGLAIARITPLNLDNVGRMLDLLEAGLPLGQDRAGS